MASHLRPLVRLGAEFCAERLSLLEPRNLVGEQPRRDLRRDAADLGGGEEHGHGKVERLLARMCAGGTGLVD